jgi:hypothetical protein
MPGKQSLPAEGVKCFYLTSPFIEPAHKEPSHRAEYHRIFGAPLFFGSHMNALLDENILKIKLPPVNPYLSQLLTNHADALLSETRRKLIG